MAQTLLSFEEVEERIARLPELKLVAIDGLPLAGKSTLADRLAGRLRAHCIYLDDFVLPQADWPAGITPGFPFPFIRYDEFVAAVDALARFGEATYRRFDWTTGQLASEVRSVTTDRVVIVEGVSTLNESLASLYGVRIWVESDADTTLSASLERGVGNWEREWRTLFLPSVAAYLETGPINRADFVVPGRGTAFPLR